MTVKKQNSEQEAVCNSDTADDTARRSVSCTQIKAVGKIAFWHASELAQNFSVPRQTFRVQT